MEFNYQVRRKSTWIYFSTVFAFAYLWVMGNYIYDAREGYFLLNSPLVIASVAVLCCVMWLLIGASVAGDASARDLATRMYPLTWTLPTAKTAYLGGRFLAAFALNVIILLAIPAGLFAAMELSGAEKEILGPLRTDAYLACFFYIILPNIFFATAIQFTVATLTRRAAGGYLGGMILFTAGFIIAQAMPDSGKWGELIDPMCFTTVMSYTSSWSPLEKNSRLILDGETFLVNRLLWFVISISALAFTCYRFRFRTNENIQKEKTTRHPHPGSRLLERLNPGLWVTMPEIRGNFGFVSQLRQLLTITSKAFLQIAKNKAGIPLLVIMALIIWAVLPANLEARNVPLTHRTDVILNYLTAPVIQPESFWIIIVMLTIYYAGELIWQEREAGLNEIANTAPVREWQLFVGRFLAVSLVLMIWMTLLMIAGILTQITSRDTNIELLLYFKILFGMQLPDCLLFALLALFLQVLINHKYLAYLVSLLAYVSIATAASLGIEHKLLIFSASPRWTYTDMAGFGSSVKPWLWFKIYWISWSLLLGVLVQLFWMRGNEKKIITRIRLARGRITRSKALFTLSVVCCLVLTGSFIFYNTNVVNEYRTAFDLSEQRADYEKLYRKYIDAASPMLKEVKLQVEIYPKQNEVTITGEYVLLNKTSESIDSIHIATADGVETHLKNFDQPSAELLRDTIHGHHIYRLADMLRPGDSVRLFFDVNYKSRGFSNNGADAHILDNGSSFSNIKWLPAIGYQPYRELDDAGSRKKFGLEARAASPSLYDIEARKYAPFPEQIRFEATIGTDADQQVVAPGTLRRVWIKNGRRYFHYMTDAPIRNEYSFFSANYALAEGKCENRSEPAKGVSILIYYPPGLTENPTRMIRSVQASLDYYTSHFGPYPHQQLRFIAHPGNSFGNHAAPINITTEEGFFLMKPAADPRGFDLVSAVVAHEVAHQWWGNMIKAASVEGAGLITESLAWYSAMCVFEEKYGADALRQLLDFMREENENPRTRAALPLLQANDWYQNYRKGPLALYTLRQYIGRDNMDKALRNFLAKYPAGTIPFPTSLDLYREFKEVTADSLQPLLYDLFEANTFWELKTDDAAAKRISDSLWQVTIQLHTKKLVIDSIGNEKISPMKDWVEIGIFSGSVGNTKGKQIYLQKHLVKSGSQTIQVTVPEEPFAVDVDPRHLFIDWKLQDNYRKVELKE